MLANIQPVFRFKLRETVVILVVVGSVIRENPLSLSQTLQCTVSPLPLYTSPCVSLGFSSLSHQCSRELVLKDNENRARYSSRIPSNLM